MRYLIAFATASLLLGAPAQAEVVSSSDTDFVVRSNAAVPVGALEAWTALIAPAKWWSPEHTWSGKAENLYIDSQATGCFCELLPLSEGAPEGTRRGSVEHLHIVFASPGKLLRMTGGLGPFQLEPVRGLFTVTLKPEGEGTRLQFEYEVAGLTHLKGKDVAPGVDKVVSTQLERLAALLGGKVGEPATDKAGG